MHAEERRTKLLEILQNRDEYQNATRLANQLGVSRQVIVSDVAILRERGWDVISTPRGYLLDDRSDWGYSGTVACRHDGEGVRREFYIIVDNGGSVIDISVEHPIYGQLTARLDIRSRYDADLFIERCREEKAALLSSLTDGLHLHRIGVQRREDFLRIRAQLKEAGILAAESE
ncbi:MAG: transcription repressor NadR [Firmicutes bacterium]|nr:transcription repressor NadR [Bacillota bacterium]